jgi:endonuclease/exonuclease/phosphatase family metal-dependent hydrolase
MFGLDGRSFWKNMIGHWAIHYQSNFEKITKRINFDSTLETVKKSRADVIGVCELLSSQCDEFREGLFKLGYKHVIFIRGHKLKRHEIFVTEVIASKYPFRKINISNWKVENSMGGGGGFGRVYIPKFKTTFLCAHLALQGKKFFMEQINSISKTVKNIRGNVVLVGDFNKEGRKLREYFPDLILVSGEEKSCSTTAILRLFYNKDIDHVFARGFRKKRSGVISGNSDHKLVWTELR